jgi:hypothetical protein
MFEGPLVKTLYEKLIMIDILLSHVKLNKVSMVTSPAEQKKFSRKKMPKNWSLSVLSIFFLAEWGLDSLFYV